MGGPIIYHGSSAGQATWPSSGGGGGAGWRSHYFPASELLPCTTIAGAVPPVPMGLEQPVGVGEIQGGSALQFPAPGAAGIVRALCTWSFPPDFDNSTLPQAQVYFMVDTPGAIGNRRIDWWVWFHPYEDQYVLDSTSIVPTDLGRNVLVPPAPTPEGRIYFTPEVDVIPSDPEGYLDPNLFLMLSVQRGGIAPINDDYTGGVFLLGLRLRYLAK